MRTKLGQPAVSLSTDFEPVDTGWSVHSSEPAPLHWLFHPNEQNEMQELGISLAARPWSESGLVDADSRTGDSFTFSPVNPEQRLFLHFRVVGGWYELGVWAVDFACWRAAAAEGIFELEEKDVIGRLTPSGQLLSRDGQSSLLNALICDALVVPPDFLSAEGSRRMFAISKASSIPNVYSLDVDEHGALKFVRI